MPKKVYICNTKNIKIHKNLYIICINLINFYINKKRYGTIKKVAFFISKNKCSTKHRENGDNG